MPKRGIDVIRELIPEPTEVARSIALDSLNRDPWLDLNFQLTTVPRFRADPFHYLWTCGPRSGATDLIAWQGSASDPCTIRSCLACSDLSLPKGRWYPTPLSPAVGSLSDEGSSNLDSIMTMAEAAAGIFNFAGGNPWSSGQF